MARRAPAAGDAAAAVPGPLEVWLARARGVGALLGFAIVFMACQRQGFTMVDAALRGLAGAVALSLVAWWSALMVVQALMRSAAAQARSEALDVAAAQVTAARAAQAVPGASFPGRSDEPS